MKYFRASFEQDDCVYILDILITEIFICFTSNSLILSQKQICRIAGASLTWKQIAYFLHFYICYTPVFQFNYDIHNQQRAFISDPGGIAGQNFQDRDFLTKHMGEKIIKPLWNVFRVHDLFEKAVIQKFKTFYAGT